MGTLAYGYTTGACATAAAKGAALMLRTGQRVEEVRITLPRGEVATFRLRGQTCDATTACCYVVKDAGSDPDVTHGAEIHVTLQRTALPQAAATRIIVQGGAGIGRVTKPGLAVGVGEPAINPVPRQMISAAVQEAFEGDCRPQLLTVTVSIPNGAELAKKTLNERLGILGGLSILGTTGIVTPISAKAWTDTIDTAIDVARATGGHRVVLATGRTSELAAQRHLSGGEPLPEEAFVMMGDYVGYALASCANKGVREVVLAGQFAKLLKIGCGHGQTHVSSSALDLGTLAEWLRRDPLTAGLEPLATRANTARQVLEESGRDRRLMALVCEQARAFARQSAPGLAIQVLLVGYTAEVLYSA
jgi:cobalt-precorrin-5B (C1)-methyltransferase